MSQIGFSPDEKQIIVDKIQRFFREEFDQDIGRFDAEFLLEFFQKELGGHVYNRGLHDAQAILKARMDSIIDAIYEIEKPVAISGNDSVRHES